MNSSKKYYRYYLLCLIFTLPAYNFVLQAQEFERCNANHFMKMQEERDPEIKQNRAILNKLIEQQMHQKEKQSNKSNIVYATIPVVFHVLYRTQEENIDREQIESQLQVLKDDYRRQNSDRINTSPRWNGVAADTQIDFQFANITPSGNYFSGITWTNTSKQAFNPNTTDMFFIPTGGRTVWDGYLNIFVCNLDIFTHGVLGFAPFPGGPSNTDAVVIDYRALGRGLEFSLISNYNEGRTCTHEVGHWLNLEHIWGSDDANGNGSCNRDDGLDDTPNSNNPHNECEESDSSCGSVEMVENFMDYHFDNCMNLFTKDQGNRMRASINSARSYLKNHTKSDACLPSVTIGTSFQNETKQITSYNAITAQNDILQSSRVNYYAKNRITLENGFSIDSSSELKVDIVGSCN